LGATCHRCAQGKELLTSAEALLNSLKTKENPSFVETTTDEFIVRAGGVRFCHKCYLGKDKDPKPVAFAKIAELMREQSVRFLAR
jgi:hypothetical protein